MPVRPKSWLSSPLWIVPFSMTVCAAAYLWQSQRCPSPTLIKSAVFFAMYICLFSQVLASLFSLFLQGTEKMLCFLSGRPIDLKLLDLSQCWVLTKSKYSTALHISCLLSWEENGKWLFPAFWKKKITAKTMNFHKLWSLLVFILILWDYSCFCSSTEVILLC